MSIDWSIEDLRKIVNLLHTGYNHVNWIWHGGEVTLMGLDWFRKAQEVFLEFPELSIKQSMQSNLTNINQEWHSVLRDFDISVGTSYDPLTENRIGSDKTLEVMSKLSSLGVICVINSSNYFKLIEIYEWFKDRGNVTSFRLNDLYPLPDRPRIDVPAEEQLKYWTKYFDYYVDDCNDKVSDSGLNEILELLLFGETTVCKHSNCIGKWLSINSEGNIGFCDLDCYSDMMLNIDSVGDIRDVWNSDKYKIYREQVSHRHDNLCSKCSIFRICLGACSARCGVYGGGDCSINYPHQCELIKGKMIKVYSWLRELDFTKKIKIKKSLGTKVLSSLNFIPKDVGLRWDGTFECEEFQMYIKLLEIERRMPVPDLKGYLRNQENMRKSFLRGELA
jgi:uncharacterized protein